MNPTGWDWITIGSGLAVLLASYWRWRAVDPTKKLAALFTIIGVTLLFLFSFMQWATWYK